MANIFFRYGDPRNLTFVLGSDTLLGWPGRFRITHPIMSYRKHGVRIESCFKETALKDVETPIKLSSYR